MLLLVRGLTVSPRSFLIGLGAGLALRRGAVLPTTFPRALHFVDPELEARVARDWVESRGR